MLVEIGVAVVVWRLGDRARKQQLTARTAALFAGGCAVLLMLLIATDWPLTDWPTPGDQRSSGTSTASLSGTVQSVLLFGVGLLSYESGQLRAQERLDESVTAAGLGGIVDHVVDVEVGLAFLSSPEPPDAHGWTWSPGKPLQWLRQGRDRLHRTAADRHGRPAYLAGDAARDRRPRVAQGAGRPVHPPPARGPARLDADHRHLAQRHPRARGHRRAAQGPRRARGAPRRRPHVVEPLLVSLRARARLLAYFLELKSGADPLRPEVLDRFDPLPVTPAALEWAADPSGRDLFGAEWTKDLQAATEALGRGVEPPPEGPVLTDEAPVQKSGRWAPELEVLTLVPVTSRMTLVQVLTSLAASVEDVGGA